MTKEDNKYSGLENEQVVITKILKKIDNTLKKTKVGSREYEKQITDFVRKELMKDLKIPKLGKI